jgi:hypothetical protein
MARGKPMKVWYDSEFEERGGYVDLISMGFVREDGKELYFVLNSFDTLSVARNDWLMKNVMTSIPHIEITSHVTGLGTPVKDLIVKDENLVSRQGARNLIMDFVHDIWPEFWAWYGAYDHVALCSLFGRMIDLPERFPMFTCDLKQLHKEAGKPAMPQQPAGLHNALEDAKFNRVRHEFLEKLIATPRRTWIIAENMYQAKTWLKNNERGDVKIITHPDQLRGPNIKATDEVVALVDLSEEMAANLQLAKRG